MKKILSVLLCFVLLLSVSMPLASAFEIGTTYYVDPYSGNDENAGTDEGSAWKTLEKASNATYKPGDRILLKAGGIFNGSFTAKGNGTAENPVIISTYGDTDTLGKPIIRSDEEEIVLLQIDNVSGWTVENIEFTAPNGSGIFIRAYDGNLTTDITVRNCTFHDIWYKQCSNHNGGHCPIMLRSTGEKARLRNITLKDCNIYDCAFGIKMSGLSREHTPDHFVSPEESYNTNYLIEGMTLNNVLYDGIIIMSVYDMVIRNCALINTAIRDDFNTAPLWSHHAKNYVIENCEIAGSTNEKDGMTVDFDGWTTDATYQYIYSHDNVRFINNCCYDNYTKNANCTVRYCLSVNDNKLPNKMTNLIELRSLDYAEDERPACMDNFKFYNNTMINCSEITCMYLTNSVIANNIFVGKDASSSVLYLRTNAGKNRIPNSKFDGVFSNNCFWNMGVPSVSDNNFICNPKFVGTDETDKNSFVLSADSKLIGKGIQVEKGMGSRDFYGNQLTDTHNIGCYEGTGEQTFENAKSCNNIKSIFGTFFATIAGFFKNIFNIYWMA